VKRIMIRIPAFAGMTRRHPRESRGPGLFLAAILLGLFALSSPAHAESKSEQLLNQISFNPPLGTTVPLETMFKDETDADVRLGDLVHDKAVIIAPVYFECPMLCTLTLNGLLKATRALRPTAGTDFTIVAFSIDPKDTPALAEAKRESYSKGYNRPGSQGGWRFLTGTPESIAVLGRALGFTYVYDAATDQYGHASAVAVLAKDGKIIRGLEGPEFEPKDLKLALIEAAEGRIGTPLEKALMYCYSFDGSTGRYSMQIMKVVRTGGAATALLLGLGIGYQIRRERRRAAAGKAV